MNNILASNSINNLLNPTPSNLINTTYFNNYMKGFLETRFLDNFLKVNPTAYLLKPYFYESTLLKQTGYEKLGAGKVLIAVYTRDIFLTLHALSDIRGVLNFNILEFLNNIENPKPPVLENSSQ